MVKVQVFCGSAMLVVLGSSAFQIRLPARKFSSARYFHVATDFILGIYDEPSRNDSKVASNPQSKLSRPERKALERARKSRKNSNHRRHNFAERQEVLQEQQRSSSDGRYDLHSTAVAKLNDQSSAEDVMRAIKRAQNLHDAHDIQAIESFILEQTDSSFAYGYRGSLLARLAVAALHMNNHELARNALEVRRREHRDTMLPMESAAIIRGLLRVHNVTDASKILDDELALPVATSDSPFSDLSKKEVIKHRALSLASVASRHFFENEASMAVAACARLAELGPLVREAVLTADELHMPWPRILRGASQCEAGRRNGSVVPCPESDVRMPCNFVYSVLNAMTTFPSDNTDRVYELLANALVRRVVFVTGAVSMDGCPPSDRGEAVFIGRSNVGKSSLVNMVTNRKSLAYTSKRPGKTQQFNFFAVNDKPGREKEIKYGDELAGEKDKDSFYIVDLPGFGYAKVPNEQRTRWSEFMREYVVHRRTLRVLFHLVDGRIGATDEDSAIMKQIGESMPSRVTYVVVLTKADKNKNPGKVPRDVMTGLRETMVENGVGNAPIILTSAETKLGRDDMWRYLRLAAEA